MEQLRFVDVVDEPIPGARIKIVGVGGCGGNAVNRMIEKGLTGMDFIALNTDRQALGKSKARTKVLIGEKLTNGLGAGGKPDVGRKAMEESWSKVEENLEKADMIILTAGLGGGTGTGAIPLLAKNIKEKLDILTIAIVTLPFSFENKKRENIANNGLKEVKKYVDTLLVIPNDKIYTVEDSNMSVGQAFRKIDDILFQTAFGIYELINNAGVINLDFADVKTILQYGGKSIMGMVEVDSYEQEIEAINKALQNQLLADSIVGNAKGVLMNIVAGPDFSIISVKKMAERVNQLLGPDAELIYGLAEDPSFENKLRVTIIATGMEDEIEEMEDSNVNMDSTDIKNNDIKKYQMEETQDVRNTKVVNAETIFTTSYSKPPGFLSSNLD